MFGQTANPEDAINFFERFEKYVVPVIARKNNMTCEQIMNMTQAEVQELMGKTLPNLTMNEIKEINGAINIEYKAGGRTIRTD